MDKMWFRQVPWHCKLWFQTKASKFWRKEKFVLIHYSSHRNLEIHLGLQLYLSNCYFQVDWFCVKEDGKLIYVTNYVLCINNWESLNIVCSKFRITNKYGVIFWNLILFRSRNSHVGIENFKGKLVFWILLICVNHLNLWIKSMTQIKRIAGLQWLKIIARDLDPFRDIYIFLIISWSSSLMMMIWGLIIMIKHKGFWTTFKPYYLTHVYNHLIHLCIHFFFFFC